MQCANSCMAPKAVSQRPASSTKSSVVRTCGVRRTSHAAALHAVGRRVNSSSTRGRQNVRCQASMDPETVMNLTYAGLGLGGLSFVGTFFVAPQFKDSFKEDLDWREIYQSLSASGVQQIDAADAYAKSSSGRAILLDVRLGSKYEAGHAEGSLSTPLYLPIQKWDIASSIRRAGFAFFGIYGTELNTNFAAEVVERVPKGKQIIVVCESGGSIENKSGTKFGFQSRSLKAIYYLQKAGLNQVAYVKGGLPIWAREGYPMAQGPEDLSAVPALQPEAQEEAEQGSSSSISSLLGGLKLPEIKLPQFSFGSARR